MASTKKEIDNFEQLDDASKKRLDKWCWGAFLLCPFWGIRFRVWVALLALLPFVNIIVCIVLGIRGKRKAWIKGNYRPEDLDDFLKQQRNWGIAGAVAIGCIVIFFTLLAGGLTMFFSNNALVSNVKELVRNDPGAMKLLGNSFEVNGYSYKSNLKGAFVRMDVTGAEKQRGIITAEATLGSKNDDADYYLKYIDLTILAEAGSLYHKVYTIPIDIPTKIGLRTQSE